MQTNFWHERKTRLMLLLVAIFAFLLWNHAPMYTPTDLDTWINDSSSMANCVANGTWPCRTLSYFSGSYLLNSWLLSILAEFHISSMHGTTLINAVFLLLPVLCFFQLTQSSNRAWLASLVYIVSILASPLSSFYVVSGALELQSGVLWGVFMLGFFFRNHARSSLLNTIVWSIALVLWIQYKDINIVIAVATVAVSVAYYLFLRRPAIAISYRFKNNITVFTMMVLLGLAINLAYNFARYDSLLPHTYMAIAAQTRPSLQKSAEFLVASFFSPNGGLLVFWTLPFVFALWFSSRSIRLITRDSLLISFAPVGIAAFGLSFWWVPFGWDAFGHRLILPYAFGALIFIIGSASIAVKWPANKIWRVPSSILVPSLVLAVFSAAFLIVIHTGSKPELFHGSLFNGPLCIEMAKQMKSEAGRNLGLSFWKTETYYGCATERFLFVPGYTDYR